MVETDHDTSIEGSSSQSSVNYDSDNDSLDNSSTDSSSEDDPSDNDMISIPDNYMIRKFFPTVIFILNICTLLKSPPDFS